MRLFRPTNWTFGGVVWLVLGVALMVGGFLYGSTYTVMTGLAFVGFAPLLTWLKDSHLFLQLIFCTGLFVLLLLCAAVFSGPVDPFYRELNKSVHSVVAEPFDYYGQFLADHPLTYGAGHANLFLGWLFLSLLLWWFRDTVKRLKLVLFPINKLRWFAPFLFCLGYVAVAALLAPLSRDLALQTRKDLYPIVFNIVTFWLIVWHVWLIGREAGARTKAIVYALINLQIFHEISFYSGLILIHGWP